MIFNDHHRLEGRHAFLGASNYHWLNYDEDKLINTYHNMMAKARGTRLHSLAAEHISLHIKMPRNKQTLNSYINDAIGYGMTPEQILYFSDNCFGTADAISFDNNKLRIHDLKTGTTPAHMEQLYIYAALFCLEYGVNPSDISIELRIYQNDQIEICEPKADDISDIMFNKIIPFDALVEDIKREEK